ncbi:hypothetical protein [Candidatus Enterococcus clewellii]|uniref:Uncharacterized protein n=1 Tax=Candidatus Enterococcus clewellii TaxID=1834193 RepID=A0AAQ3W0P1_9ENTE
MYEAEQVVLMIEELNSISTFHRWRKLAEECCGISFQKKTKQVGETSYSKYYLFSESDIEKFRKVAIFRNKGQPIREAIIEVFEEVSQPDPLPEQNKQAIQQLEATCQKLNGHIKRLLDKQNDYDSYFRTVYQTNSQLEKRMEEVEAGKMDKPFLRKKS